MAGASGRRCAMGSGLTRSCFTTTVAKASPDRCRRRPLRSRSLFPTFILRPDRESLARSVEPLEPKEVTDRFALPFPGSALSQKPSRCRPPGGRGLGCFGSHAGDARTSGAGVLATGRCGWSTEKSGPALGRLRQEDRNNFEARVGNLERLFQILKKL